MGQAQSRVIDDEQHPARRIEPGVRVRSLLAIAARGGGSSCLLAGTGVDKKRPPRCPLHKPCMATSLGQCMQVTRELLEQLSGKERPRHGQKDVTASIAPLRQ